MAELFDVYSAAKRLADMEETYRRAQTEFPVLGQYDIRFKASPRRDAGYMEFWPADEPGAPGHQRPKELPMGSVGVELYRNDATPADIAGDVASHYLVNQDPRIRQHYESFVHSLTPRQEDILRDQYAYARENFGETRDYGTWRDISGLPAYFRGYPFKQWSDEFNARAYEPEQMQQMDEMMRYLRGQK